jgi:hypothetical protein
MREQIVMDRSGDTRHRFDPADSEAVAGAERRFRDLTGAGFIAAERTGPGESKLVKAFNPDAEATVFFPQLKGG